MKLIAKISLPLLSILMMLPTAKAQTWQWATKAGGAENDYANAIDVDHSGNSYVAGKFYGAARFGSTVLANPGEWSVYIAKYDVNGNLVWAKIAAGDSAISVSGISLDVAGNILITGQYFDTATFGTTAPVTLVSSGDYDVYVAKYDSAGEILWAKSTGGAGIDYAGGVSTDNYGNVFLTGDFHVSPFPYSSSKIFIAKYDSAGNNSWTKMESYNGTNHFGNGIKTDSAGNSYITGEFFNTIIFNFSDSIVAGNVESNIFLAKFDSSGNFLWGKKAGAPSGYAGSKAVDIGASGNAYITGYYHGTIYFDSYSITSTSGLAYDVFVAKCDAGGNFTWANKSTGAGSAKSITLDNAGNAYVCGTFAQPITFGSASLTSAGSNDVFITRLNSSGNFVWATSCGGLQDDYSGSIKANANGICLAGYFTSTIYFGSSLSLADSSNTKTDIFTTKLNSPVGIEEKEKYSGNYFCFPNPAENEIQFRGITGNEKYALCDAAGKIILQGAFNKKNKISIGNLSPGVYFIRLTSENKSTQIEFIKK